MDLNNCSHFFCTLEVNVNRNLFSGEKKTIIYADLSPAELCSQTDGGGYQHAGGDITSAQLLQLIAIAANSHSNIKRQMYAWSAAVSRISGIYPNSMAGLC